MNYGEVALGVECALPKRFEPRTRRKRWGQPLSWLLFALAAVAML